MSIYMLLDSKVIEFEWDGGNQGKNKKHGVEDAESEEPFFDSNKIISRDPLHSKNEERFILIGKTKRERILFLAFAKRKGKIRIISARDLNRKERHLYEEKN